MSVQTALYAIRAADATLAALISTRLYPDVLPQEATLPAVRYQVIGRQRPYTFGNSLPSMATIRVQMDGYAGTSVNRSTLAAALRGAFNRAQGSYGGETVVDIRIENELEDIEMLNTNTEAYRIMLDMVINLEE